jgi:hypothetical protein
MRSKLIGGLLAASILTIPVTAEGQSGYAARYHAKNPGCQSNTCDQRVGRKWWKKHHPKPKVRAIESNYSGIAACIRKYESGGNYRAVSKNGLYRGAYQFDYATFAAAGGHGDPAAASPAEQDAAFARWWPGHHSAWPRTSRMCGIYS